MTPAIFAIGGGALSADERAFFADCRPAGFILFGRNCESSEQLRALTDDLRSLTGRDDVPILIDQEGGRVARLKPPLWPAFPPGSAFDRLYDIAPASAMAAARANAQALASVLADLGINVDCLPLLDVRQPGASDVIGDRALGTEPMRVAALGRAILSGLRDGGVVGVMKHIPGHGRSTLDTHLALPTVTASDAELKADLAPFAALADAPMAMTAHIIYTAWDAEHCATLSPTVIGDVIRGRIGFDGLLMTDDMDMKALSEGRVMGELAAEAIAAGCDLVLNCWAKMDDMVAIAKAVPSLSDAGHRRLDRAMEHARRRIDLPPLAELTAQRDTLLALG